MRGKGRRHISWKTKCAAALLDAMAVRERFGLHPGRWYNDAKKMTEAQFLSLFQFDHNILHETGHPDRDQFWNLTPRLIQEHREKTKLDAKIIAKGRRIRADALKAGFEEGARRAYDRVLHPQTALDTYSQNYQDIDWSAKPKRKIRSRGFDKSKTRHMDGTTTEKKR